MFHPLTVVEAAAAASRHLHDHAHSLLAPAHDLALRLTHSTVWLEASLVVLPLALTQGALPALAYVATNAVRARRRHHH